MTRLLTVMLATLLLVVASPGASAQVPPGECGWDRSFDPPIYTCNVGGGDDPGEPPRTYWTGWTATGYCAIPEGQSILWERSEVDTATGSALQTETTCVEPDWGIVWEELERTAAAVGVPDFNTAPPDHFGAVVGSPMLLWYSGQSQIQPITATITSPEGVVYGVEGRAWIEQITWNMGDGSSVTSTYRDAFDQATFFGDFDQPEVEYTFETTSVTQGYDVDPDRCGLAFTPVSVTLTWTGEYRSVEGLLQTTWNRVPANLDITETFEIPVREIRSSLTADGADPPDNTCSW